MKISNNKLVFITLVVIFLSVLLGVSLYFILDEGNTSVSIIKISQYDYFEGGILVNEVEITNRSKIKKIVKMYDSITVPEEEIPIAILNEIIIEISDKVTIYIGLDTTDYCFVKDLETSETYIANMPEGLLEYVQEVLSENS